MSSRRLVQLVGAVLLAATVGVVSCQALIAGPEPTPGVTGVEQSGAPAGR